MTDVATTSDPTAADPQYRARRARIASLAAAHTFGSPVPDVDYTGAEHETWRTVAAHLAPLHAERASSAFRDGACRLDLPRDRIAQLREVNERLQAHTGFRFEPVPGLVPPRDFFGALADGVFCSTQYVRHPSVPLYTPEPDVVHELVGHANALANRDLAWLHREAGRAVRRTTSDTALHFLADVFWFSLEFGVVFEDGGWKAYGAGLCSSFGELGAFHRAEIRRLDVLAMGATPYDITQYQPVLFGARSHSHLVDELGAFFTTYDEDAYARLVAIHDPTRRHRG
jgi:phenylalanine-4-hydroxylase